jgi:hypothetical protein
MSEDKLSKRVSRGKQAKLLMQDALLVEAFENLKQVYVKALMESHPSEDANREKLYIAFNLVGKVQAHLASIMSDGTLADHELARLNDAPARE